MAQNKDAFLEEFNRNPLGALETVLEEIFEDNLGSIKQRFQFSESMAAWSFESACATGLARAHPELRAVSREDDLKNARTIGEYLAERGWQVNPQNLKAAFCELRDKGKLALGKTEEQPPQGAEKPPEKKEPERELADLAELAEKDPDAYTKLLRQRGMLKDWQPGLTGKI
ncbi:MAG: hypothetical protein ACE5H2_00380 [Terriglobia bacterium]